MRRKQDEISTDDDFRVHELPTYRFRIRDVVWLLDGIPRWRLEKFLSGKRFKLSPSGHIGMGSGAWRFFNYQDVYRLAIAYRMSLDGFAPKLVSDVLKEIRDEELLDINRHGESTAPHLGLFRKEEEEEPRVEILGPHVQEEPYYVLKLDEIIRRIDGKIMSKKKEKEREE